MTKTVKIGEYYQGRFHPNIIVQVVTVTSLKVTYQYYNSSLKKEVKRFIGLTRFKEVTTHLPGYTSPLWKVINDN